MFIIIMLLLRIMKIIFATLFLFVCLQANAVEKKTNFSNEIFNDAKKSGKTIVINSYEVWCGTCGKQTEILNQAEKEFKDVIFLSYEQSKNKNIAKKLGIKFWTTIVVYKGNNEVARIVGQTNKKIIYSAIQKGA
jgi:thioredoxin 1